MCMQPASSADRRLAASQELPLLQMFGGDPQRVGFLQASPSAEVASD